MLPAWHIAGIELRLWPLCATVGVLLCWVLLVRRAARLGYRPILVFLWVLLAFPVGALCAGAGASLVSRALGQRTALASGGDGLSVTGSIIGCTAFSLVYVALVFRERPWRLLDSVAFTFGLSVAFGRIGCLLNGCCYGRAAGFSLPPLTVLSGRFAPVSEAGLFHHADASPVPLWNLALMLSLNALTAMAITEWFWRRRERLADGMVFFIAILCDSVGRSVIEIVRQEPRSVGGILNPWQAITIVIGLGAAAGLVWRRASLRGA